MGYLSHFEQRRRDKLLSTEDPWYEGSIKILYPGASEHPRASKEDNGKLQEDIKRKLDIERKFMYDESKARDRVGKCVSEYRKKYGTLVNNFFHQIEKDWTPPNLDVDYQSMSPRPRRPRDHFR